MKTKCKAQYSSKPQDAFCLEETLFPVRKVDLAFWAELREEGLFSEVKCNMVGGVPKQVLGVLVGYFSNQSRGHAV